MKILSIHRQKGFTLVEVIATIVIAGVIGAMTFSYFGKSFVDSPKTVSNLNKALSLQAVMENITRDYLQNYAASDNDMLTMSENIGSAGSTIYDNNYGRYMVVTNDFIKFSGGVEAQVITGGGGCRNRTTSDPTNLLKVTIKQPETGETLSALFTTGGATGSSGTWGCKRTSSDSSSDCACYSSKCKMGQSVVSVSVSPTSASMATNATQQFSATVSDCSSNQGVTWSVQETGGGTVDSTGLYKAPNTDGLYHIVAASVACPNRSATATVVVGKFVTISPTPTSITTGGQKQFTAKVYGMTNTAVTWSVQETGGGTVEANGLYTPPSTAGTYHVVATSVEDTSKSATATVTVSISSCSCSGGMGLYVSVTPSSASITTSETQQFTATVNNCSSNTGVTWSVTTAGGGTIDENGLYIPPANAGTYYVKALSNDCSRYDTSAVAVTVDCSIETTPPTVSSTNPVNGATGVAVGTPISVTFSEAMDASTINNAFSISGVSGTISGSGTTYTLTPSSPLAYGTSYTPMITTGAKDACGNSMSSSHSWSFTTEDGDTTPPTVLSKCPSSTGYTGTTPKVTFSEAMDALTITTTTFTLKKKSDGSSIGGSVSYDPTTEVATFTPISNLTGGGTYYTATITTGAKDLAGNAMTSNYTWDFKISNMSGNSCP